MSEPAPATPPAPAPSTEPSAPSVEPQPPGEQPQGSFVGEGNRLDFAHASAHLPKELHGKIDGYQARFQDKTVGDLFQSYSEAEAQLTQLMQSNAVPDAPTLEAYGIGKPEGLDDDSWKAESPKIEELAAKAHELGIGKEKFAGLFATYIEQANAEAQSAEAQRGEQRAQHEARLRQAWGAEFSAHAETAANHINAEAAALGLSSDDPMVQQLLENPVFFQMVHRHATKTNEGSTTLPTGTATTVSAPDQARDIMTNPANPLHEKFIQQSAQGGGDVVDMVAKMRSSLKVDPRF